MKLTEIIDFNPPTPLAKGQAAPFVDMATLSTDGGYISNFQSKSFSGSGSKFRDSDTLFARITPCLENGKGGFVRGLGTRVAGHGSTEFIVFRAKKPSDSEFIYYVSREPQFRIFAQQQMSGTSGRQRVAWQSLANYEIPNHDADERAAIGATLAALDDKIDLNRHMNETLEEMARAIFKDWFVDFGPTRAKAERRAPYLAPQIWELFPGRLDDEDKPEGWKNGCLGDVALSVGESVKPNEMAPDTPYIGLEHMPRGSIALNTWEGAGKVTSGKLAFHRGDFLFGKLRPYFHKVGKYFPIIRRG